jgi:hypothetical protein
MKKTYAAHLIPKILKRRKEEFDEVRLHQDKDDTIRLTPLWLTSFGYNILNVLDAGTEIDAGDFENVERALKQVNLEVMISFDTEHESVKISDELREFVLSKQSRPT